MSTYVHIYICIHMYIYIYEFIITYVHMYTYVHIYMYIYVYMYMCIYAITNSTFQRHEPLALECLELFENSCASWRVFAHLREREHILFLQNTFYSYRELLRVLARVRSPERERTHSILTEHILFLQRTLARPGACSLT